MKLTNCENAFVAKEKLLDYLLDDENSKGKSIFFHLFGYFKDNFEDLGITLQTLACSGKVTATETTKFGTKFIVDGVVTTPNGRSVYLTSVWIIKNEEDFPRVVTVYPM